MPEKVTPSSIAFARRVEFTQIRPTPEVTPKVNPAARAEMIGASATLAMPTVMIDRPVVLAPAMTPPVVATPVMVSPAAISQATLTPATAATLTLTKASILRDHRLVTAELADTRTWNPKLAGILTGIRLDPILFVPSCPAGGEHDLGASSDYTLAINRPGVAVAQPQSNWRWCRKCLGLAFGGHAGGVCAKGGAHDFSQSSDYVLSANTVPSGHQNNWRWCRKCDGLAFAGNGPGLCPAGGNHDHSGSWDYALPINQPDAEGQPNWRWCRKCQALAFAGGTTGMTREELGLPVAAADPVTDSAVFEAPTGSERYYLPHYSLAHGVVNGSDQYQIRMAPDEFGQWALTATLDKLRPEGLPGDSTPLAHDLLLRLVYSLTMTGGGMAAKTLDFTEYPETRGGSQIVARMHFASPAERDQVLGAITSAGSGCGIVAIRRVRVAVPIPGQPDRYRPVTRGLEQQVDPDPLLLIPSLHPYLYDGAVPASGGTPGFATRQIQHEGRFHKYWEDVARPGRFFYLPDAFRLARRDSPPPYLPLLGVALVPGTAPDADPAVALEIVATPWLDLERLEAARREFARSLPPRPDGTPDEGRISLEPLPVGAARFWLALPGAPGGGLVERPGALVDVGTGISLTETLSQADFQLVFDALMGGALSLMRGEVRLDFGQGTHEAIPFDARFDRMNGELFVPEIAPGAAPGEFSLTLRNAIESPLLIERLDVSLLAGATELPATARPAAPLPLTLGPGESFSFVLGPAGQIPDALAGTVLEPLLGLGGIRPQPDAERIWAAVFDESTGGAAQRTIRVKLFSGMFDAASGRPEDRALAVIVNFENGATVELTPDSPEGTAKVAGSIADRILGRAGASGYRYKTQVIWRTRRAIDPDWRSDNADLLIPFLPEG